MYVIHAERDSVCMGDSCKAPNAEDLECEGDMTLSGLLEKAARYVPPYGEAVWAVTRGNWENKKKNMVLGFVIFADSNNYSCELAVPEGKVGKMGIDKIFCRYFHRRSAIWDDRGNMLEECYPQYEWVIDMVKAELEYEKSKTV